MENYFDKVLKSFVGGRYTKATQNKFYRWLVDSEHATEKDEALQNLWVEAKNKGIDPHLQKSLDRWKRNNDFTEIASSSQNVGKIRMLRLWQSVAAVLVIVVASLTYLVMQKANPEIDLVQQFIPIAEMRTFCLPDGSKVQLNSKSTLLYPKEFTGKNRSVYLIGEANFRVKPDKKHPFIVKSDDFQVTALGTEFNVNAYAENSRVSTTLLSGSVQVEYKDLTQRIILEPEEQLTYDKKTHRFFVSHPNIKDITAWQRGELVFSEMTVEDIIRVLERRYNYTFVYSLSSLKNDRFSFRFKDKAPLPEVMDIIVDVVGNLAFKIDNQTCYIKQK